MKDAYDYDKELGVAKDIARRAGETIKRYFNADQRVMRKADNTVVTIADTEINRFVIEELEKHFDDGIIGEEESTAEYGMGRRWVCDPIDGTAAFTYGLPTAMFSLALVVDGEPVLGVAYDPFLDMLYEGTAGGGSFCNGERLHVSAGGLAGGRVGVGIEASMILKNPAPLGRLLASGAKLATFSGAVYKACLVSRGRLVGHLGPNLRPHDVAAVEVLVREAGGTVSGLDGERLDYTAPFKGVVLSNGVVHEELLRCLS
jgi:fructose-1,6-bisphosphatase/inositol monophosphatase family enzyme